MKKIKSLIKATFSEGMQIFKFKSSKNNLILPIFLSLVLMFSIGSFYDMLAKELQELNLINMLLGIALILPVILTFIESIYKAQGMLYECKDNDLLLSLPITKKSIIFIRILKMYIFEFLYMTLFSLPAIIVYIIYAKPNILFYILSILEIILLPIVPLILGSFIGYLIKSITSKSNFKKLLQTVFTFIIFFSIYYFSANMNSILPKLAKNAKNINDLIYKIYYPIGSYIYLIEDFNIIELLKLLLVNIIPLGLFIYIVSFNYFKVINREKKNVKKNKNKFIKYKKHNIVFSLIGKDFKRYLFSPVYVFNTLFGMILLIISTIGLCINFEGTIEMLLNNSIGNEDITNLKELVPIVFYSIILIFNMLTSITSSMISIEGKTFSLTKSLPVKSETVLLSKILTSMLIVMPFNLTTDLIFIIYFKPAINYILLILLISFLTPLLSSLLGILFNLKYPKMNASSDTEVIKQSMSSVVSIISGMTISVLLIMMLFLIKINITLLIFLEEILLIIICIILIILLKTIGIKKYQKIEI